MPELIPMTDEDIITTVTVVLAAYSEKFPQLKGKGVGPETRDYRRQAFARELIARLKLSHIQFCREATHGPLMLNTGCFPPHK